MTETNAYGNPEPVPPASQLAVLPFLAAVDGYLREDGEVPGLRITVHRAMSREGHGYLQQVCACLREGGGDWQGKVGRFFAVDTGIIGAAYGNGKVWRTRRFRDVNELNGALTKDGISPEAVAQSWLAVPFLGPQDQVVLILYADCTQLNFFADDARAKRVVAMSKGFCRLLDWLQRDPFENLRNFPLQKGEPVRGVGGLYSCQESVDSLDPPKFTEIPSFNYEAAAA
jgi:hypothetical protein